MYLGAVTLVVKSYAPDTVSGGVISPGAETTSSVYGTLVPFRERDRQALPEGIRERATHRLYTDATLTIARDGVSADIVVDDETGRELQVISESNWTRHSSGVPHRWYALAERGGDGQ